MLIRRKNRSIDLVEKKRLNAGVSWEEYRDSSTDRCHNGQGGIKEKVEKGKVVPRQVRQTTGG